MSWPLSIFSAVLTGVFGLFVSGFLAALAVDWYNVPSREGASGYFVVFLGLFGFAAGLVIGIIVARMVAGGAHPGFFRALGMSLAVVAGIGLLSGGIARALADVPPTIGGETLLLQVELRWPADRKERPVTVGTDDASLSLHSIPHFSHTVRVSESGPLWMEDAHLVDGRWVVPGAVRVFTSRGTRMLSMNTGENRSQGFQVPLSAFPGKKYLEWSDWGPNFRPGVKVPPDLLSFRFRVVPVNRPIRTEAIGPFEVETSAWGFFQVQRNKQTRYAASGTFGFRYRGQPLIVEGKTGPADEPTERFDRIDEVAVVPGPRAALLVHADPPASTSSYYYLVVDDGDHARIEYLSSGSAGMAGRLLTSDSGLFRAIEQEAPLRGVIDRESFSHPGFYRIGNSIVDTRVMTVRHYAADSTHYDNTNVAPLGLSPDERSFVTFATSSGTEPPPVLLVTDFVANTTYTLPVDPVRMHYAKFSSLDPAWLNHHFEWKRQDGVDRLVERPHFAPLPWQGELSVESDGHTSYTLQKASEALRGAMLDFLTAEFKAARQPADSDAYEIPVTIDGKTVNVAFSTTGDSPYVAVSMTRGSSEDAALITAIGKRFDAVLATGKYDGLFSPQ